MKNNNAQILINAQKLLQKELDGFVTDMGVEAKNHFVKSFKNQGFTDNNLEKWQPRKGEITGGIAVVSSKAPGSRAILVKSGDLRRSIKVVSQNKNSVTIGSDLPYAQIHNEGGIGKAFGKYRFKMPKRKFIGFSTVLNNKLINKLKLRIKKAFK